VEWIFGNNGSYCEYSDKASDFAVVTLIAGVLKEYHKIFKSGCPESDDTGLRGTLLVS